jgi:hypothetical protein
MPMKTTRTAAAALTIVFESEQELLDEYRTNLSLGALRVETSEAIALNTLLLVTLRGPWDGEAFAQATVVMTFPGALALAFNGDTSEMLQRMMAKVRSPAAEALPETENSMAEPVPDDAGDDQEPTADAGGTRPERRQNTWDIVRSLPQIDKILLAVKAERIERALLLQDSDPRVLLSLLRNPRLTVDEVARLAKSSSLSFQIADVIMKAGQWMGSPDVRLALVQNPKTPPAFALRILPTLPESEIKAIAKGGTSMALKQAALRRLQNKS